MEVKRKLKKFSRQCEDYILTDLMPVEKGNFYTHSFFYDYLVKNNIKNYCRRTVLSENKLGNQNFHAAPLKYKIKNKESFREISLLNPLSIVESFFFIQCFGDTIINMIDAKNLYGQRIAKKTKSLLYKKNNGQTVYYTDNSEKNQFLFLLESSGIFYKHKPYKLLHQFIEGRRNTYLLDRYRNVVHFDIENFFGSIYTHSFTWQLVNNHLDALAIKNTNSIYNNIDTYLQNINGAKTNGIVVGPEISRLLADFLLVHIEQEIYLELLEEGLIRGTDYELCRFVDDYYLYTNNQLKFNKIFEIISDKLNKYHLKINSSKTENLKTIEYFNPWLEDSRLIISSQIDAIFPKKVTEEEIETSKKISRKVKYSDVRNTIQIAINRTKSAEKVCAYIQSAILNKLESRHDSELNITHLDLTNLCFYLLSKNPRYTAFQKVIRICTLLLDYDEMDINYIERAIVRFEEEIFTGYISDWINLILFCGANNIRISEKIEREIIFGYIKNETKIDPRILAAIVIYLNLSKTKSERDEYYQKIKRIINDNLSLIDLTDKNFFLDEHSWWIFIFNNCPIEGFEDIVSKIRELVELLTEISDKKSSKLVDKSKRCVLKFLEEKGGFINWNISTKDEYNKLYFYTRRRTIFGINQEDGAEISF